MKNKFAKNLGILGIIGLLVKVIGAFYRVPLAIFMSEDAVAYYSLAYPWYNILIVISTTSIPAVIAKLTAEAIATENQVLQDDVYHVSKRFLQIFGIAAMIFLIGFAGVISNALGYPESRYSFYVLGIAAFFVSQNAAYRGYFQGTQRMEFYGISQLIEQLGRVIIGLGVVAVVSGFAMGDGYVAAAGTSGAFFGAIISWGYSISRHRKHFKVVNKEVHNFKGISKRIFEVLIPIAIGASIMPLLTIIDGTLVVWRLRDVGFIDEAAVMYSYLSFYSTPIINISQVVFSALEVSLLPMITRAFTQKNPNLKHQVDLGILLSVSLGMPMGVGIWAFAEQILLFLYPSKAEIAVDAAPVLGIMGLSIVLFSVFLATTSILQGIDKYRKPVLHLGMGAIAKVISAYILIAIPSLNIVGAAYSTLIAYFVAAVLNVSVVYKSFKPSSEFIRKILMTIVANVVMVVLSKGAYGIIEPHLGMRLSLMIAIMIAVIVYGAILLGAKIVTKADFDKLGDH